MGQIVSKAELAKILGKDEKTLLRWHKDGLPIRKRGKRGVASQYDTEEVVDWLVAQAGTKKEMDSARIRLANAQARKVEIEIERMEGEQIALEDMKLLWANVLARFRAKILALPARLAMQLADMNDPKKIERLLKNHCAEALNELAEYDPETNTQPKSSRPRRTADSSRTTTA